MGGLHLAELFIGINNMAIFETKITRFDGGISDDIREQSSNSFSISKHFDIFSNPKRLVPYRSTEADEDKTKDIVKFQYAPWSTGYRLFGLGVVSGGAKPKIFFKGADPITDSWAVPSNGEASTGARSETVFFHYKNYLYGWRAGTALWRFGDTTGSATFTDSYQTISYTDVAQPVHHPADDIAYFFQDNVVHKLDNTTWTSSVLTLPDNLIITSGVARGNYLAIACKPKTTGLTNSVVFLWDRDSSLATISGKIDWGEGDLFHIANLDGNLIGVTDYFLSSIWGIDKGKIITSVAVGEKARVIKEVETDNDITLPSMSSNKFIKNNKLYFAARIEKDSVANEGIYVVDGRGNISLDYVEEEVTTGKIQGIFSLGNYWFIAHSGDGSVNRTNNDGNYTYTSVYESQIFAGGDSSKTKKLIGVTIMTDSLPTAGQVVIKYRKDEETSWTTIFTNTTDNSISHSAINIESSGATLPEYKEIQFRIESTGGAEITGLKFKYEEIDKDIY